MSKTHIREYIERQILAAASSFVLMEAVGLFNLVPSRAHETEGEHGFLEIKAYVATANTLHFAAIRIQAGKIQPNFAGG